MAKTNTISVHEGEFYNGKDFISSIEDNNSVIITESTIGLKMIPVEFLIQEFGIDIELLEPHDIPGDSPYRDIYLWRNLKTYVRNPLEYIKNMPVYTKKSAFDDFVEYKLTDLTLSGSDIDPVYDQVYNPVTDHNGKQNPISPVKTKSIPQQRFRGPERTMIPDYLNPNITPLIEVVHKYIELSGPTNLQGVKVTDFVTNIINMNYFLKNSIVSEQFNIFTSLIDIIHLLHKQGLISLTKDEKFGICIPNLPENLPFVRNDIIENVIKEIKFFNTYEQAYNSIKEYSNIKNLRFNDKYIIAIIVFLINNVL